MTSLLQSPADPVKGRRGALRRCRCTEARCAAVSLCYGAVGPLGYGAVGLRCAPPPTAPRMLDTRCDPQARHPKRILSERRIIPKRAFLNRRWGAQKRIGNEITHWQQDRYLAELGTIAAGSITTCVMCFRLEV
ncbi:hypothetical protein Pla52o_42220 [Novipirellula galeiformis]|uniref:Uncharacterized protein n=1 Tax=Novipirellula galeiformis TaxID=2528004 RepID=A0A5C6CAE9_9BACT|nr:hypothetical protein Pla52o_42220 [Novipirellula galeiformis]